MIQFENRKIRLLLTKLTDDLLIAGKIDHIRELAEKESNQFIISKIVMDGDIMLNGATISQKSDGNRTLLLETYLRNVFMKQVR